jgi:ferredoxin
MRIVVDFEACTSNAMCMGVAPTLFEVREDGFLYLLDETPAEGERALVELAVNACPNQAISIAEDA